MKKCNQLYENHIRNPQNTRHNNNDMQFNTNYIYTRIHFMLSIFMAFLEQSKEIKCIAIIAKNVFLH